MKSEKASPDAPIRAKDTKKFLAESKSIDSSYIGEIKKSRRTAWVCAGLSFVLGVGGLATAFVALNKPDPDPVVLRADVTTGSIERIGTLDEYIMTLEQAENEYWINRYVNNREGYNYTIIQTMYDATVLMSAPNDVQTSYAQTFAGDEGLDKRWRDRRERTVSVNSIQNTVPGKQATVRFSTQIKHSDGRVEPREYWVATMSYVYAGEPMSLRDRMRNPVGFQVTSYRVDPEIVQ